MMNELAALEEGGRGEIKARRGSFALIEVSSRQKGRMRRPLSRFGRDYTEDAAAATPRHVDLVRHSVSPKSER